MNGAWESRRSKAAARWLLLGGVTAAAAVQGAKRLADFDLPWHLALGRSVWTTRALPTVDPLAFTHRPIEYMEFLSDLALFGVHRVGGELGLQLLGAVLLAAVLLLCLARSKGAGPVAWLVLPLVLLAIGNWVLVRPATLSLVLVSVVLFVLERHRQDPDARASRVLLFSLVPLCLLWANLHGFVVIGVGLVVSYAAYCTACRRARGRFPTLLPSIHGEHALAVGLAAAGCALSSGGNLAGFGLWLGPWRAAADFGRIAEWQTPAWSTLLSHELGVVAFLAVAVMALAIGREPSGERLPQGFDLGLWLLALALGCSAYRMIPVATVIIAPLVSRRLASRVKLTSRLPLLAATTLPVAVPLFALNTPTSFGVGFEPRHFPEPATRWVEQHELHGRMWNFLPFGGYLAWRLYPRHLVLVDGRSGWVHSPEILSRYHASLRDRSAFESLREELSLEWAIVAAVEGEPVGAPLAASSDWALTFLDDSAAVYVRRAGPNRPLEQGGYRVLRHLTPLPAVLDAATRLQVPGTDLAHDARLAVEQAPDSPRARFVGVCGAIAQRDAQRYWAARNDLAALVPGHPSLGVLDATATTLGLVPQQP